MSIRNAALYFLFCIFIISGYGCKTMTPKERASAKIAKEKKRHAAYVRKLKNLSENEIYVVGKVEIYPPLGKGEQDIKTFGTNHKNHIMTFISGRRVDPFKLSIFMMKDGVNFPLNKTYIAKRKYSDKMFYSGSILTLSTGMQRAWNTSSGVNSNAVMVKSNRVFIAGGVSYNLNPGDKAIYIGTIRIQRDKNNNIKKTKVLNHYRSAKREFRKLLGNKIKLKYKKPRILKPLN